MTKRTVFVTGAGGFIGRHLVKSLLDKGHQVTALMLPGESIPGEWEQRAKIVEGDIRTLDQCSAEIGSFDVLYHLAAVVSDWGAKKDHVDVTVKGTEHAIDLALKSKAHFIVTTSVCAYANALAKGELNETSAVGKASSYYEMCKQEQEHITLEAVNQRGLEATIVRPGNVFGVGSQPWVNTVIEIMRAGNPIMMGKGDWDAGLVHVQNLVHLMLLIADSNYKQGDIFLGSDGFGITWKEYLGQLSEVSGAPKPKSIPNIAGRILAPVLEGIGHILNQKSRPLITRQAFRLMGGPNIFSTNKARECLSYEPIVSFEQAMNELAAHFEDTAIKNR
ncbi:MAG: NAD-dependent dehydratase [Oleiphilus sp.]|nr:MAG: NAD-dependent dehydratase [Oleiphilus sp.]